MRQPWTSEDGIVTILEDEDSTQATQAGKAAQKLNIQPSKPDYIADGSLASFSLSQPPTFQIAASQTSPCRPPRSQLSGTHNPISTLRARTVCQNVIGTNNPVTNLQSEERALRSPAPSPSTSEQYSRSRKKPRGNGIDPLGANSSPSLYLRGASSSSKPTIHGSRDANQFIPMFKSGHTVGSQANHPIDLTEGYEDDLSTEDFSTKGQSSIPSSSLRAERLNQPLQPMRNLPIAPPLHRLSEYTHNGIRVNPKANVELSDGDFIRIVDVIKNSATGAVHLRGWLFRRAKEMNGILERKYNELCWILHVDEDDSRDISVQAMESVPVTQVVRRRKIRLTNQTFPAFSFREDGLRDSEQTVLNERVLVCRFKYICTYASAKMREQYRWSEKSLQRLRADDCDPSLAKADEELRYDWRGPTERGGECAGISAEEEEFRQQEYQRQDDLRVTAEDNELSNQSSKSDTGLGDLHTSSSQAHDKLVNIPNSIPEATKIFIDLTDSVMDSSSRQGSSGMTSLTNTFKKSSIEVIDIDAIIDTTTMSSIVQKKYPGQATTSFVPHPFSSSKRKRPDDHTSIPGSQSKRVRTNPEIDGLKNRSDSAVSCGLLADLSSRLEGKKSRDTSTHQVPYATFRPGSRTSSNDDITKAQAPDRILTPSPATSSSKPRTQDNRAPSKPPSNNQPLNPHHALSKRKYTLGDSFSGAGGFSRGAIQANLHITWAFDSNPPACASYALNNPHTSLYPHWANDFCALPPLTSPFKVDICHLSPPCQFFSDAHTVMGKDDDMNTASLFAISEVIKKGMPRVVTLEQTSGLLRRHGVWFNAVVLMFTALGFSVRWRVLNCADFGVPQRRMRVFVIASW